MTPRWDFSTPARRSVAKSCSRNCTGMSRRRASSPIGTGPASPVRPSSVRAFSAYGLFVVIEIIRAKVLRSILWHASAASPRPCC